jgi:long-chain acyl-CoA synthetase
MGAGEHETRDLTAARQRGRASLGALIGALGMRGAAPAVVAVQDGARATCSYEQLATDIGKWAREVRRRGAARGHVVGIIGANSAAWIACCLGILAAGATAMPLDERLGDEELLAQLAQSDCRLLVASPQHAARAALKRLPVLAVAILEPAICADGAPIDPYEPPPGDVALLLHTSGTTGTPKAVPLTHANLAANLDALLAEGLIGSDDRVLVPLPYFHAYPIMIGMLVPLAAGATIVFASGLSGPEFTTALQAARVTHLVGVPRLYEALMQAIMGRAGTGSKLRQRLTRQLLRLSRALRRRFALHCGRRLFTPLHRALAPDLRLLVCGGAAIAQDLEERLEDLGWEVLTGYGLTETSPVLTFNRRATRRAGTAGRAIAGVALRIADPDERGIGQIEARGDSVFAGYRGDDAATRRAFTTDGWFRTGDLGRIESDGTLRIAARASETLVLADGRKLFPETVEARYAGEPVIAEIALLADAGRLVGLVVPELDALRAAGAIRAEGLIREALERVAAALPPEARLTGFAVTREQLPRTHLGKLKRHLLAPILARARLGTRASAPAPLSLEDQALLTSPIGRELWPWLQARFAGREVSLDTSPQLELGIDSLAWMNLTLDIQSAFGVHLTEDAIARVTTLRELLQAAIGAPRETARETTPPREAATRHAWLHDTARWPLHALTRIVMRLAFPLEVRGLENLPGTGAFVICPNHASYLDPFALAAALPWRIFRRMHWAGWTGILFRNAAMRAFSRLFQVIPIDPDRALIGNLARGGEILARGAVLAWFPEGVRSADGRLQEFLPGVALLIAEHDVPAVPTRIAGSFEAWPRHHRWPRRAPIQVTFGEAMRAADLRRGAADGGDATRIAGGLRAAVAALADTGA